MNPKRNIFVAHKTATIMIISLVAIVAIGVGVFYYLSEQSLAKQQADHVAHMEKLDKQHEQLKKEIAEKKAAEAAAKKKAEEEARKKAEQEAESKVASKAPKSKNCKASDSHSNPSIISVVVNKKRCFSPLDFVPADLVTSYDGAVLSAKASKDFAALAKAINKYTAKKDGTKLSVTSSYRSYASQVSTYNYWVSVNGSAAAADKVSARPGYSEHQTGFTVDLAVGKKVLEKFAGTYQHKWLVKHAAEYGFIERYPAGMTSITGYSPEPWHYRYVGKAVAQDMKAKGIVTLEKYWDLEGGDY